MPWHGGETNLHKQLRSRRVIRRVCLVHNMPRKLMKPISIPSCQLWPEQAVEQSTPAYHVHTATFAGVKRHVLCCTSQTSSTCCC